jgi:type II secretory pathway pseudopilin PulG
MGLRGQDAERGYAMAALLIALVIMTILLSVAMPVWRHEARREKEAELVFRGEQYARAIALFRFKNANIPNAFPASIDALVQGRFLRKKYKDPMTTTGEFELIGVGSQQPGINPPGPTPPAGRSNTPPQPNTPTASGMMGVRSKSTDTSIRSYRGATRYDQWSFTFNIAPRPGGAMPMANTADGRGNNPTNPNVRPGGFPPGGGRGPRSGGPGGERGGRGPGVGPGSGFPPPVQDPGGSRGPGPGGRGRGF